MNICVFKEKKSMCVFGSLKKWNEYRVYISGIIVEVYRV